MSSYLWPLLIIHIASGCIALISGVAAMVFRKGGPKHARWGTWFFVSMLVMATTATLLALFKPEGFSAIAGVLTIYLVATSWSAGKQRDGKPGRLEWLALPAALGCMAADLWLGQLAAASPDDKLKGQAAIYFAFAGLAGLAAVLDINMILRGQLSRQQRIARHLWRMCVAYFIAATALFLGQQHDVFFFMIGSPILVIPSLATLAFMVFWLVKLRIKPVHRLIWTSNLACATERHNSK